MKSDVYTPCPNEILALERLLKDWDVLRKDCNKEEKAGFRALRSKGLVRISRGVYHCPRFSCGEDLDAWFRWFEKSLGLLEITQDEL
tara:strand:+ start:263 stop:523 length:261 start_codon:yes stop_codon:yes gene_type:complete